MASWIITHIFLLLPSTAFLIYVVAAVSIMLTLVCHFEPLYGQSNILVYLGICSLAGSLTVMLMFQAHRFYIFEFVISYGD